MKVHSSLLSIAVAAAFGTPFSAIAAPAVFFDQNGTNAGGGTSISELGWSNANAIVDNALETPVAGGAASTTYVYAQSNLTGLSNNGNVVSISTPYQFTYQFRLPVASGSAAGGLVTQLTNDTTRDGYFRMFASTSALTNANFLAGSGFGDNNTCTNNSGNITTATGCSFGAGQILILEGTIRIRDGSSFNIVQDPIALNRVLGENNGQDVATRTLGSTTDLDVFITSVDTNFWAGGMVGTTIDVDLTLDTVGFNAPFASTVAVSDRVVGVLPFFGDAESSAVVGHGITTLPINDFACASSTTTALTTSPCDLQLQTSGNSHFTRDVPEPGSLALLGVSLMGLAGLARRRKQRQG